MAISPSLRIPDLDRRVQSKSFKGWVKIESYGFGNSAGISGPGAVGTGAGTGRVRISSINMVKKVDDLSAPLHEWISSGRRADEAVLFFEGMPPGSAMAILLLQKVNGDSVQWAGSTGGDEDPTESFTLSFETMQFMPLAQYLSLNGMGALVGLLNWFR